MIHFLVLLNLWDDKINVVMVQIQNPSLMRDFGFKNIEF
jgi:hypothetical protein